MNEKIVVSLFRIATEVLRDVPPFVPSRGAPLASVLTSRKLRLEQEYKRIITQRGRDARRNARLHVIQLH